MKRTLLLVGVGIFLCLGLYAQEETEKKVKSDFGVDFMSRYVWRGLDYGSGPSIQPWTHTQIGMFNFTSWGGFSAEGDYSEVIVMAGVTLAGIKFQINDAFVHREDSKKHKFFDYDKNTTRHNVSTNIFFGGTDKLPVKFRISTFFHGADRDANGDLYYSTYIKATYPFGNDNVNYAVHLAMTPYESVYRPDAGIVDMGITFFKKIKINENYSLPISAAFIMNPYNENLYFVLGLHL